MRKEKLDQLALFGGPRLFPRPVSTSNLVKPDLDGFLGLLRPALTPDGEAALVAELERELAAFHGVPECVAVCSGFWALVLATQALARPGCREVVMPSLTYRRLADIMAWAGLVPRFTEVDPRTLAISPETAAPHLHGGTALLVGVHPIVNCCDAPGLEALGAAHGIPVLFDGVESVYEVIGGRRVGGFGSAECFSFHASKLINGFEGGYITTRDPELAALLRRRRAPAEHPGVAPCGMDARMPAAHAAMALQGLRELPAQLRHNLAIYRRYAAELPRVPGVELMRFEEAEQTSFKTIVVRLAPEWPLPRAQTLAALNAEGVLSRAYYSPPLHQKPTRYPVLAGPLLFTEHASADRMLMPCGHQVTEEQVTEVIDLMDFLAREASAIQRRLEVKT